MTIRILTLWSALALAALEPLAAQDTSPDIVTAQEYFGRVSEKFATVTDYSCSFSWTIGENQSSGTLYYRSPNLLRLDFSEPAEQVILMDGEKLQIVIPKYRAILREDFATRSQAQLAAMMDSRRLEALSENFDIAYFDRPDPVPLDEAGESGGAAEMVMKLKLTRRNPSEMYREIVLSVGSDLLIRRFAGVLEDHSELVLDLAGARINQSIPASRFKEEAWADYNVYEGFLTGTE